MCTFQRILPVAFVIAIASCTTASIETSWRAPNAPALTSVVTLAPGPDSAARRNAEDQLAHQLMSHGVRAVPAYSVLNEQQLHDLNGSMSVFRRAGFDGVVAMKMVSAEEHLNYYPTFDGYWGGMWGPGAWGTVVPTTVVRIQINAYSLTNNQLVWSAVSKSVDPDSVGELVSDVTKVVSARLEKDHVVGATQASAG
jgi:hypothetical protein